MTDLPENNDLIDWPHVGAGVFLTLDKADDLFSSAKFLYDSKKFRTSISLFIIALEEILKAHEFAIKFRKNQSISEEEWNKLTSHKHKLVHIKQFVLDNLSKIDEPTSNEIKKETGNEDVKVTLEKMIQFMKTQMTVDGNLQELKEKCLYVDWDKTTNEWDTFDRMDSSKQEDLAFYLLKRCEQERAQLFFGIEFAVNVLRKEGKMLKNLDFPKYDEIREIKDYESKNMLKLLEKSEQQKFSRGYQIMMKFVATKAFSRLYQELTFDKLKKVLELSIKHPDDKWYPHPMIRALLLAISALNLKNEDGKNYAGFSGNAEETDDGEPTMLTSAIVSIKDGKVTLEKLSIVTEIYDFSDKIIDKILDTELVIDRFSGMDIPLDVAHEAFSKIGIKLRRLKDDEIETAINYVSSIIDKVENMDVILIPKVKVTTKENWNDVDPEIRALIGSLYLGSLDPEPNTMILSSYTDPIRKFIVRDSIYHMLTQNQFISNY